MHVAAHYFECGLKYFSCFSDLHSCLFTAAVGFNFSDTAQKDGHWKTPSISFLSVWDPNQQRTSEMLPQLWAVPTLLSVTKCAAMKSYYDVVTENQRCKCDGGCGELHETVKTMASCQIVKCTSACIFRSVRCVGFATGSLKLKVGFEFSLGGFDWRTITAPPASPVLCSLSSLRACVSSSSSLTHPGCQTCKCNQAAHLFPNIKQLGPHVSNPLMEFASTHAHASTLDSTLEAHLWKWSIFSRWHIAFLASYGGAANKRDNQRACAPRSSHPECCPVPYWK